MVRNFPVNLVHVYNLNINTNENNNKVPKKGVTVSNIQ